MSPSETLEFHAPGVGLSFRAKLLVNENPDVIEQVLAQLPLQSVLGHVVVSGEAIWMPTRIVHIGRNNMVQRHPGAVYLYAPGQTICLTYGRITESATVNKFAEVFEEDLPILRQLGELVYEQTIAQPRRSIIEINVRRAA
ncbi:hypothetical protein CU102_23890 [Phyllobacterium brassicacearum]|uniref:DUF3830 domain-containing protein n=1 Tax=Phyllobacterium brassicacearum TaxID=314235 RepID=A0A2P7BA25_9HYPH|nr:DUF3830 family protein [Phyllobacterium brassicacearum]PSH63316.1 hypothetical protein CU102_23890 [Phyllobacterium brassicacearum]TDQ18156.1 uncharacterized protein DUF3830 [Phyllobacterium brassicacearum]